MKIGSKEFDDMQKQFEQDLAKMPIYIGAKPVRSTLVHGRFYDNGTINSLFVGYMYGYQNAKCMARLGEFD